LLERIPARLCVADGYVFGDWSDLDMLCMDVWHRFAPEPSRTGIDRFEGNGNSVLSPYLKL
jgi:hypothetical protein